MTLSAKSSVELAPPSIKDTEHFDIIVVETMRYGLVHQAMV